MSVPARPRVSRVGRWGALAAIALAAALSVSSPAAAAAPHIIRQLVPGPGGVGEFSNYFDGVVGSTGIFTTDPGLGQGQEPWRTDGTKNGTSLLRNINPGSQDSGVSGMVTLGNVGFFEALDSDLGYELWRTNGTTKGTRLVKDIDPSGADSNADPLATMGGKLFFSASDGSLSGDHGNELWTTTGKPGGTKLVKDIAPGPTHDSGINKLASIGTKVLFIANDDSGKGLQLFVSDGTAAHTHLLKVINDDGSGIEFYPGAGPLPAVIGHTYYFGASDGTDPGDHGFELWKSDGTAKGTKLVKDLNPGPADTTYQWLHAAGSKLFFSAQTSKGMELWVSDGTAAGTHLVKDIDHGAASSDPYLLGSIGKTLYFAADDGATHHGSELWKSDGTTHGTRMVKDIQPGTGSSSLIDGVVIGSTLLFGADTTANGREVWRSNGTKASTHIVADLAPGPTGSDPDAMGRLGKRFFFIADDGVHGREPWIYTP